MFGHLLFWLLKAKINVFTVFTAAKIPLIAALIVLGTTDGLRRDRNDSGG